MIYYELLNFVLLKVDRSLFSICIIGSVIFASLASMRNEKIKWRPNLSKMFVLPPISNRSVLFMTMQFDGTRNST
jgi:hypothetical protein